MSRRQKPKNRRPADRSPRQIVIVAKRAWALLKQIWPAFVVLATLVAFRNDWLQFWRDIRTGDGTWFWVLLGVLVVALWLVAWYVSRTPRLGDWLRRLDARFVRWGARALLVLLPLIVVAVVVWWVSPPKQTVVLVADFVDPTGVDSARVTQSLVEGMRETLKEHFDTIAVKRLDEAIKTEGGRERARVFGSSPVHKAVFVIWGDYTLDPDPELHIRFEILRQTETYLRSGQTQDFGPMQIQQPSMFDFKAKLASYLGQLTAFASGLALYDSDRNVEAIPLFDTAAHAIGQPLAKELERPIRFYRAANYLALGRALDATSDLQALAPAPNTPTDILDGITLAALNNLGIVAFDQGDYGDAEVRCKQALALYRQFGIREGEAATLSQLGLVTLYQGHPAAAKEYMEQALALHEQLGNPQGQATVLGNLGLIAQQQGDLLSATTYHKQALTLNQRLHNFRGRANDLGNLGTAAYQQGDYPAAEAYHQKALTLDKQLGNTRGQASSLGSLGLVKLDQGNYLVAKSYFEQALALHEHLGDPLGRANDLGNLGMIAFNLGSYSEAATYLERALALHEQAGTPFGQAIALGNLGLVAYQQGTYPEAKAYLERALELDKQIGNLLGEARDLGNLGQVARQQRDYTAAKTYHERALMLHQQLSNPLDQATDLGNLGLVAYAQGDYASAEAYLTQSATLHHQMGLPVPVMFESKLQELTGQTR